MRAKRPALGASCRRKREPFRNRRTGCCRPIADIWQGVHNPCMGARAAGVLLSLLTLTGCSYPYDLRAIVLNGRLGFIVDPNSEHKPGCIRSIHVQTDERARARPAIGDDKQLVSNGVFWWKDYAVDACPNPFPILYGQPLAGRPFTYRNGSASGVEAKPLRIGVIYEVDTTSSGSGFGEGRFRIRADHTIENLPMETAPAVLGNVR